MFSDVKVSRSGAGTVVTVRENNLINRVVFEGNKKVEKGTLEAEVEAKARGGFSEGIVQADLQRIREIYRRAGRGTAKVSFRTVDLPNGRIDLIYVIEEGDKTGIKAINFVGNSAYSESKLRELMSSSEMNFLSFIKTSDVYDPDRITNDLDLVRRYYLKNGYADFRVVNADARYVEGEGDAGWVITVTVDEGQQYTVGAVAIDSRLPGVDTQILDGEVRAAVGDVYNAEDVEENPLRRDQSGRPSGLPLRPGSPDRPARPRHPHRGARLRRRRRPARLCRAHQHPRQHPYPRLCHPPRARYHRGRRLQSRSHRSCRASPERPRLLQKGPLLQRAGLFPPTA